MANWTNKKNAFGSNRTPLLQGLSSVDGVNEVPIAVNPATGAILTSGGAGGLSIPVSGATVAEPVAIVDSSGNQITSFGGGTQYTDAGTPPAHPVGPTIEFNNAGAWNTVGSATPLPITIASGNPTSITANAGTNLNTSALALETGGNLAAIKTDVDKIPALGQAVKASSAPVTIASDQTDVPFKLGQPAATTATFTTASALNATFAAASVGYGTVTLTAVETGTTTTAGDLTFEVYDGTNWIAVMGRQLGGYSIMSSYALVNGTTSAWRFNIAGFQQFRVRLDTQITGTGSPQVVLIMQLFAEPLEITPAVGLAQKLDTTNDAISDYEKGWTPSNLSASAQILSGAGSIKGFFVNSYTATATLRLSDALTATTPYLGAAWTITGTGWFPLGPYTCATGGYVTVSGTADVTYAVRLGTQA